MGARGDGGAPAPTRVLTSTEHLVQSASHTYTHTLQAASAKSMSGMVFGALLFTWTCVFFSYGRCAVTSCDSGDGWTAAACTTSGARADQLPFQGFGSRHTVPLTPLGRMPPPLCTCRSQGVQSTGWIVQVTMPAPILLLVVILCYNASLPGAGEGLKVSCAPRPPTFNAHNPRTGGVLFCTSLGMARVHMHPPHAPTHPRTRPLTHPHTHACPRTRGVHGDLGHDGAPRPLHLVGSVRPGLLLCRRGHR